MSYEKFSKACVLMVPYLVRLVKNNKATKHNENIVATQAPHSKWDRQYKSAHITKLKKIKKLNSLSFLPLFNGTTGCSLRNEK